MYKLALLICFVAIAAARPSHIHAPAFRSVSIHSDIPIVRTKLIHEPTSIAVQEHTIAKVGEHVERIPTAVSHQSQTIVHSQADKITPIVAPAIRTHYAPAVRTVEKQYIEKIPVVESYVSHEAPSTVLVESHETPSFVAHHEEGHHDAVVIEGSSYLNRFDHRGFEQHSGIPLTQHEFPRVIESNQW